MEMERSRPAGGVAIVRVHKPWSHPRVEATEAIVLRVESQGVKRPEAHAGVGQGRPMRSFTVGDREGMEAHLARERRVLVCFSGESCPYSSRFEPRFAQRAVPGWSLAVRRIEHGGRGPHAEAAGIVTTPTVVAYGDGQELARLEARLLIGITGAAYDRWLEALSRLAPNEL